MANNNVRQLTSLSSALLSTLGKMNAATQESITVVTLVTLTRSVLSLLSPREPSAALSTLLLAAFVATTLRLLWRSPLPEHSAPLSRLSRSRREHGGLRRHRGGLRLDGSAGRRCRLCHCCHRSEPPPHHSRDGESRKMPVLLPIATLLRPLSHLITLPPTMASSQSDKPTEDKNLMDSGKAFLDVFCTQSIFSNIICDAVVTVGVCVEGSRDMGSRDKWSGIWWPC
jgi:hypothetical protein